MSTLPWWRRLLATIDRVYERRIRSASNIAEYGAHGHTEPHADDEAFAEAEIVNLPRGTRVTPARVQESPETPRRPDLG